MKLLLFSLITFMGLIGYSCGQSNSSAHKSFQGGNGVNFDYQVIESVKTSPENLTPVLIFSSMEYDAPTTKRIINLMMTSIGNRDLLLVIPFSPKKQRNGWINHPSHHALEEFLDKIRSDYSLTTNRFILIGYKDGCIPAQTYMEMSSKYFRETILLSSHYWDHYEAKDFDKLHSYGKRIKLVVGEKDEPGLQWAVKIENEFKQLNSPFFSKEILDGQDRELRSYLENGLLDDIEKMR